MSGPITRRAQGYLDPVADRSGVSRAELLASLSLAVDLGLGLPVEHVLRQTVIATRLGDAAGFDRVERETAYYASLLAWVGCTADSAELARLFGDDLRLRADTYGTDLAGLPLLRFMMRNAGSGASPLRRLGLLVEILASDVVERTFTAHCDSAAHLSDQLGLGPSVAAALGQLFERWDGKGAPKKLRGDQLSPAVRALHIADILEVHDRIAGARAALDVATERAGGPSTLAWSNASSPTTRRSLPPSTSPRGMRSSPPTRPWARRWARMSSMMRWRCSATTRTSSRRGGRDTPAVWANSLARRQQNLGLPGDVVRDVRRAGFVHDIGVIGVANSVWDSPRRLSAADQERVRTHPYLTDRTFARVPTLARIGRLAALHHERVDGSGYPAGLSGDAIPLPARVLAAADVYHALREPRPHRPAHDAGAAAIERNIPGGGEMTSEEWRDASAQSNKVITDLGGGIAWKHSYVTADKVYCVYEADSPELVRTHGEHAGFPVDAIVEVGRTIDPSTAG